MTQTFRLFKCGLQQIICDGMLLVLLPAPFLCGIIFKLGIPAVNALLERYFAFSIVEWYPLCDTLLVTLAPLFISMICAFLLLEERDEGTGAYYEITPVQGYTYLMARIGLPMLWAFACSIISALLFSLAYVSIYLILTISMISALTGIALSMMIVSLAKNRVEGLAISKLAGVSMSGLFFAWFAPDAYRYIASFLPSFWIGELVRTGVHVVPFIAGLLCCCLWIYIFGNKYLKN